VTTYQNPVWPRSFADPFVLKHGGEYWAYCTGFQEDGRAFGILRSRDLMDWQPQAGALEPLPGGHTCYWAPEVTYDNGRFYLYYSVGNEETMEIRVAVAQDPAGPFEDSGHGLTRETFAIDAHVHLAADGTRWLFYATDFLERSHVGTGTVRDRMLDPFTLAGEPRPVTLPRHDWHLYHPTRPEKAGARWHTVEGSFVLRRKTLQYQMFSGGNWQNPTYGVSYATSGDVSGEEEWTQAADGDRVLPVLRTTGEVVGPGHNSVVRGPDNRQLWCVYHRWSPGLSARVMAIDPLDWAGERLLVLGPSTAPRPAPQVPTLDEPGPLRVDTGREEWREAGAGSFLCEVSARALEAPGGDAGFGLVLRGDGGPLLRYLVRGASLRASWRQGDGWRHQELPLPPGFDPQAVHLFRLEVDGTRASAVLDDVTAPWSGRIEEPVTAIGLTADWLAAEFSGLALTAGWEDLFLLEDSGWELLEAGSGDWRVEEGRLRQRAPGASSVLVKGPAFEDYELVVNARLDRDAGLHRGWEILPAVAEDDPGLRLALERGDAAEDGWVLTARRGRDYRTFSLPAAFDPFVDQQLRFRKEGEKVEVAWEGMALGTLEAPAGPARVGVGSRRAAVSFEAVRVTKG
jgi:GH43 family beta-xylosidase